MKDNRRGRLSVLLLLAFGISLYQVLQPGDLIHGGGSAILKKMMLAMLKPDLSAELLLLGISSAWRSLAYAATGMSLALLLGLPLGVLASGVIQQGKVGKLLMLSSRGLLSAMRAVHELVWAWIFVASIGLSPLSAILAIAIPYGGILGRVYADLLADVPLAPIKGLKSVGGGRFQCLFYGYFPMAARNILSYTLYRFECAIRSTSIMSFVGLGGIGYQIQRFLDDLNYNAVVTLILILIMMVTAVDLWSREVRDEKGRAKNHSFSAFMSLIAVAWYFVIHQDGLKLSTIFSAKNGEYARRFLHGLMGGDEGLGSMVDPAMWKTLAGLTYDTLIMSIVAIGIATFLMLLTVLPASSNVSDGRLFLKPRKRRHISYWFSRGVLIITRAVPELIWAMILIFIFSPGIFPGALALALHNYGILGKLCAEVIEDISEKPLTGLSMCGAGRVQMLFYGVFPQVLPKFLSYILYRWEVIMRTTIVVGFVGAGGLGQAFKMAMSFFEYEKITMILVCYLMLVILSEAVAAISRRYITS